jgi:hypothetical protein
MTRFQRRIHHLTLLTCTLSTLMVDGLWSMVCGTSSSADAPAPHLRRKTSFCASSSPSTGNETSSHGAPPVPHVCYDLARLLVRLAAGVGRGATRDFDRICRKFAFSGVLVSVSH